MSSLIDKILDTAFETEWFRPGGMKLWQKSWLVSFDVFKPECVQVQFAATISVVQRDADVEKKKDEEAKLSLALTIKDVIDSGICPFPGGVEVPIIGLKVHD
jgi:hypothetical protein